MPPLRDAEDCNALLFPGDSFLPAPEGLDGFVFSGAQGIVDAGRLLIPSPPKEFRQGMGLEFLHRVKLVRQLIRTHGDGHLDFVGFVFRLVPPVEPNAALGPPGLAGPLRRHVGVDGDQGVHTGLEQIARIVRERISNWLNTVLSAETRSGIITIGMALVTIAWANSPFASSYDGIIHAVS